MNEVFSLSYPLSGYPEGVATFAVTESEDGAIGVTSGGAWVRIPSEAYELLHNFLRQKIEAANPPPFVSSKVETQCDTVPADVARLVIAAREAWEDATDSEIIAALEKALEPFSKRVRYANEPDPDTCAAIGKALDTPAWHCGNGKLPEKFTLLTIARNPQAATIEVMQELDSLAWASGPVFTQAAIDALMPLNISASEIPF